MFPPLRLSWFAFQGFRTGFTFQAIHSMKYTGRDTAHLFTGLMIIPSRGFLLGRSSAIITPGWP